MCLRGENMHEAHVNFRLSCSTESQVDAEGEADDPDPLSTYLRVVLEQMEC